MLLVKQSFIIFLNYDFWKCKWPNFSNSVDWDKGLYGTELYGTGFYQNSLSNPTTWVTHCGDGIRTGSEKWDDGNTVNGDGWSSDCLTIESSWVWTGGSLTSKDTCTSDKLFNN